MIREATTEDIPKLVEMGERFHKASPYADLMDFDAQGFSEFGGLMIENDIFLLLVDDHVTSMLGMAFAGCLANPSVIMADELFWWSESPGTGIKLLKTAEVVAKGRGATLFKMSALADDNGERMNGYYQHAGFSDCERSYMRTL